MLAYDRQGTGIPLVFIHAFPLSRRMWEINKSNFVRNFQVIAPDLPGFGDSPLGTRDTVTMEEMAREVQTLVTSLNIKEKIVLAGVSMGGYVMFQLLKLIPDQIRALVFVSTRATPDTNEVREKRFKTIEMIEKEGLGALAEKMIPNLFGATSRDAKLPVVGQVREGITSADPKGVIAALRGMAARPDSTALLSTIKVPTLVLSGAEDLFVPVAEMQAMAQPIAGVEFKTVEKAGHLLNLEQPAVFKDLFLHFLKGRVL